LEVERQIFLYGKRAKVTRDPFSLVNAIPTPASHSIGAKIGRLLHLVWV
jgi:hypothetical protein